MMTDCDSDLPGACALSPYLGELHPHSSIDFEAASSDFPRRTEGKSGAQNANHLSPSGPSCLAPDAFVLIMGNPR